MGLRRLTDEQRRQWRDDGYFLIKGALSKEQPAEYLAAADEVIERYRAERPAVR